MKAEWWSKSGLVTSTNPSDTYIYINKCEHLFDYNHGFSLDEMNDNLDVIQWHFAPKDVVQDTGRLSWKTTPTRLADGIFQLFEHAETR